MWAKWGGPEVTVEERLVIFRRLLPIKEIYSEEITEEKVFDVKKVKYNCDVCKKVFIRFNKQHFKQLKKQKKKQTNPCD